MIYKATTAGTFPPGNHWAPGEVRALDVDGPVPAWLVQQPEPKKKAPKAKAKPDAE